MRRPGGLPGPVAAREYLDGFEHVRGFGLDYYLNTAVERILETMRLFPDMGPDDRILELAAQPYFMTALMLKHFPARLEVANEADFTEGEDGVFQLKHRDWDEAHRFEYEKFNIEFDDFPYADEIYDVVVLCETIEHLAWDPVHTLHEVNRILKLGGHFVVSTPNAFRLENFWKVLHGQNLYPPYSGWGWTARHNREFTPAELTRLFEANGYRIARMETHYEPGYDYAPWLKRAVGWLDRAGLAGNFLDVIHLSAQKTGPPRYSYPTDMFTDVHAYPRTGLGTVDMEDAEEAQLRRGWYPRDVWPPAVRWTAQEAMVTLHWGGEGAAKMRLYSGPPELTGEVVVTLRAAGVERTEALAPDTWATLELELPEADAETLELSIAVAQAWTPAEVSGGADTRELGVAVRRAWLE